MRNKKVLIVRFSSIGDIVLTTPVVRCIKQQLDNVTLHYCTKAAYQSVLAPNPYLDKIICLEGSLKSLIIKLRAEKYDYVIDLHHNFRTRLLKWGLGVKSSSFAKLNLEKWLMVNFKINRLPNLHIVDRYMATTCFLGVKNDEKGLDYFIPKADEVSLTVLPKAFQQGYVVYAIGAQNATRRLPVKRMIELCNTLHAPMVLLGSKEDHTRAQEVVQFFQHHAQVREAKKDKQEGVGVIVAELVQKNIFNACGKFNLHQSASLVQQAKVVFSHDTGLMHIATAFKKHVYVIWGHNILAFGMYPYKTTFTSLENNHLSCRPCSKIGFEKCPKRHFKCMNDIVFDEVALNKFIK